MLIGLRIQINGAGIAGLTAAIALAARGAEVSVLEKASELTEVGAGLQISPNGTAVLGALGLLPQVREAALISHAVELRDYRRCKPVLRLDLMRHHTGPYPFLLIHRADLIAILEHAARSAGVAIKLGTQGETTSKADLLIGADGLHSALRSAINTPAPPFFTGQVAWRAVITDPDASPEAHVYMGPGRHLVTYALRGDMRNIVAIEERDEWASEGWTHRDNPSAVQSAFAGFAPEVRGWLDRVERVNLWGLFRHPVAARWHDRSRVLIGDAAHPTLPFLAQGANLALEDAWVLADCLANVPLQDALPLYQMRRRARVVRAIDAANANARNYHLKHPIVRSAAHLALRTGSRLAPKAALRRFSWLYDHDVTNT